MRDKIDEVLAVLGYSCRTQALIILGLVVIGSKTPLPGRSRHSSSLCMKRSAGDTTSWHGSACSHSGSLRIAGIGRI